MAKKMGSGDVARERLKSVLREDRSQMTNATIGAMRSDILTVLSSYAAVKEEDLNFYMVRGSSESETKLMMEAKVRSRRRIAGAERSSRAEN
ncbi:MAG: cell division topological specificity factor MinE [Christensenellaceae bacterium]|jgi:cell division topological specificity factor MinE|nr:cell division topological specificity factor MinE [Christensenellaceae bacterium]